MGGIASVASAALPLVGQVGRIFSEGQQLYNIASGNTQKAKEQAFQRDQLQRSQQADMASFGAQVANQRAQIKNSADIEERRRVDALRRSMARSKALMASRGLDTLDSGSGEAILLGQINDTEMDRQDSLSADRLKEKAIQDSIADKNRRNLLEASELYERQKLQNMQWG